MLSYRHSFHAGCAADVLKHWTLTWCLNYLTQKDKPLFYLDTHSGAGLFELSDPDCQKTAEYKEGIGKIWNIPNPPEVIQPYLKCIHGMQLGKKLEYYPGSPALAAALLREIDRLALVELHPQDFDYLNTHFLRDKRVHCFFDNGFEKLKALLPPPEKRGLILIDPPYEIKADYETVVESLKMAAKRFAQGVYILWYPIVERRRTDGMLRHLKRHFPDHQNFELKILPDQGGPGMTGSGIFIINSPYGFDQAVKIALPWFERHLKKGV